MKHLLRKSPLFYILIAILMFGVASCAEDLDDEEEATTTTTTTTTTAPAAASYAYCMINGVDLDIDGAAANAAGLNFRAALCRCGKSKNKPYCDNSHESDGFQDYGAVGDAGNANADQGGSLSIQPIEDGPLMCKGNVTIFNSSGRAAFNGSQVFLCRCGASNNKPFCDGEHKKVGFKSD